jgi:hypothetical protein
MIWPPPRRAFFVKPTRRNVLSKTSAAHNARQTRVAGVNGWVGSRRDRRARERRLAVTRRERRSASQLGRGVSAQILSHPTGDKNRKKIADAGGAEHSFQFRLVASADLDARDATLFCQPFDRCQMSLSLCFVQYAFYDHRQVSHGVVRCSRRDSRHRNRRLLQKCDSFMNGGASGRLGGVTWFS